MRRSVSLGKLQEKPTVNPQLTAGFVSPYPGLGPGYLGPDQKLSGLDKVSLSLSLSLSLLLTWTACSTAVYWPDYLNCVKFHFSFCEKLNPALQ